jgi:hypothetical protein
MFESTGMTKVAHDAVLETFESEEGTERHPRWHRQVALTTMIMALLAAFGSLLAGITANEALLERTIEIIEVSYLEGDRVYVETLRAKHEILAAVGETPNSAEFEAVLAFEEEMRELEADAAREEELVLATAHTHMIFAVAVTLLALGITLGGTAVVVERKLLWVAGLVFGAAGAAGVGLGVLRMLS